MSVTRKVLKDESDHEACADIDGKCADGKP
jgi:hypothetical protein